MIVPVMAILYLVLTRQIYSEETNGVHAHYREPVPLKVSGADEQANQLTAEENHDCCSLRETLLQNELLMAVSSLL